ncbi:protein S100-A1-like [Rhinoraja longicauda]
MTTLSRIEVSMQNLIDVFYEYTTGDKYTLNKPELKKLVEVELNQLTKNKKNVEYFDQLFKDLDFDRDGEVNFEEFVSFIAGVMYSCNELYLQKKQQMAQVCKK